MGEINWRKCLIEDERCELRNIAKVKDVVKGL